MITLRLPPATPEDWEALSAAGGIGLMALALGGIAVAAVWRWRRLSAEARRENAMLRAERDEAFALIAAEPQALFTIDPGGEPALFAHTLSPSLGVPSRLPGMLRFASWLEDDAASKADTALDALRRDGASFTLALRTRTGALVEIDGRISGRRLVVTLRDFAGRRPQIRELVQRASAASSELGTSRALLEALPMPVWFRDDAGRLGWANRAFLAAAGVARLEDAVASGRDILETRHRRDVDVALRRGETYRARLAAVVSGERRAFEAIAVPVGGASAGVLIDRAPLETAQGKLERQSADHARVLDKVVTAIAIFGPDRRLAFSNAALRNFWPLDAAFLEARPSLSELLDWLRQHHFIPQQLDYRAWRDQLMQSWAAPAAEDQWWHISDERSVQVSADAAPDGTLTLMFDDVTQRFTMERRHTALLREQRETLDALSEAVAVFSPDGRLRLYNEAFSRLWRLPRLALEGKPRIEDVMARVSPLVSAGDSWPMAARVATGIQDTRSGFTREDRLIDGRIISASGVPLPDGALLLTQVDVTADRRYEWAIDERATAMEQAERTRKAFLGHVSYDMRTPLTSIIGFSEAMSEGYAGPLTDTQADYIADIQGESAKLLAHVDTLLDLTAIDAGAFELELQTVGFADVVTRAAQQVGQRLTRRGLRLAVDVSPGLAVIADAERLRQVMFTLIANAMGLSPDGATIAVTGAEAGEAAAITVDDEGDPMPEDDRATLFDRFEGGPSAAQRRGAGAGLSLARSIVELHGGRIGVSAAPGGGTRVTVLLPRATAAEAITPALAMASGLRH